MSDDAQETDAICDQHNAPTYSLLADTEIGGKPRSKGSGFCRYCIEGKIQCPSCGFTGYVVNFSVEGKVNLSGVTFDVLRCGTGRCNKPLARTSALRPNSAPPQTA